MKILDRFKSGKSVDYDKTCFHSVEKNFIVLKEDLSNAKTAHTLMASIFLLNLRAIINLNLRICKILWVKKDLKKASVVTK